MFSRFSVFWIQQSDREFLSCRNICTLKTPTKFGEKRILLILYISCSSLVFSSLFALNHQLNLSFRLKYYITYTLPWYNPISITLVLSGGIAGKRSQKNYKDCRIVLLAFWLPPPMMLTLGLVTTTWSERSDCQRQIQVALMVFKALNDLAPDYLSSMFTERNNVPLPRTNYLKRSFSYRGATLWSSVPCFSGERNDRRKYVCVRRLRFLEIVNGKKWASFTGHVHSADLRHVLLQLKLQKSHRYTKVSNYKLQYRAIFKAVILQWLGGSSIKLVV